MIEQRHPPHQPVWGGAGRCPDAAIAQNARDPKPDGIRGRVAMIWDPATLAMRVGRFGWKAQQANLTTFAGDAYLNEMGITNRFFPNENAPNGNAELLHRFQPHPVIEDTIDPATGKRDIDVAADFMRLLAPTCLRRWIVRRAIDRR